MNGYKLTVRGKSLVSGLIVLMLFALTAIFFMVAGASGNQETQPTVPPAISAESSAETEQPGSGAGADDSGSGGDEPENVTGTDAPSGTNNAENGEASNEASDPNETENTENGQEQNEAPSTITPPNFNRTAGTLTLHIQSDADGTLDDASSAALDEFLSLPQNNREHTILVATPFLEMDELTYLAETVEQALISRGVPGDRIVFTTNDQNTRTQNPTFEVSLSFFPIGQK